MRMVGVPSIFEGEANNNERTTQMTSENRISDVKEEHNESANNMEEPPTRLACFCLRDATRGEQKAEGGPPLSIWQFEVGCVRQRNDLLGPE